MPAKSRKQIVLGHVESADKAVHQVAARALADDDALRELEALRAAAEASLKRLLGPQTKPRKQADDRVQFLTTLRHALSSWRLPPPSSVRKRQPTLHDIAAQLARTIDQDHGQAIAGDAGVILPTLADMVDAIMGTWSAHVESYGAYHLGDSGSEAMIVDAFHAVGVPRRVADRLYEAHRKKRRA